MGLSLSKSNKSHEEQLEEFFSILTTKDDKYISLDSKGVALIEKDHSKLLNCFIDDKDGFCEKSAKIWKKHFDIAKGLKCPNPHKQMLNFILLVSRKYFSSNTKYEIHQPDRKTSYIIDQKTLLQQIENSKPYENLELSKCSNRSITATKTYVEIGDTLEICFSLKEKYFKVAAMRMTIDDDPEGGFYKGYKTQESDIVRRSNLFLLSDLEKFKNKELFQTHVIYSPNILVFRGTSTEGYPFLNQPFLVDIITASFPATDTDSEKFKKSIEYKLDLVIKIALEKGIDALVLGAWGCGKPEVNSELVAQAMNSSILKFGGLIKCIVFAILPNSRDKNNEEKNIKIFSKIFGDKNTQTTIPLVMQSQPLKNEIQFYKSEILIQKQTPCEFEVFCRFPQDFRSHQKEYFHGYDLEFCQNIETCSNQDPTHLENYIHICKQKNCIEFEMNEFSHCMKNIHIDEK